MLRTQIAGLIVVLAVAGPAVAAEMNPAAIDAAQLSGKAVGRDRATPLGVRVQVLLDRAHFSPGEIDGKFGENARKALRAFAEARQLPSSDALTDNVWKALLADDRPVTANYTISEKDVAGPFLDKLPSKLEDMKDIPALRYTSPREALAEKFHMSEALLAELNPGQRFDRAGDSIVVVETGGGQVASAPKPEGSKAEASKAEAAKAEGSKAEGSKADAPKADRVEVDKNRQTVKLFDKSNTLVGFYPATVGSSDKPSPTGTLKVTEVSRNPTYRYNPDYHFKGVKTREAFTIKPGPNNPVGTVWINLSAEGYGIHGTSAPAKVSKAESHGCVRLTNWDAERVAQRVAKGTPVAFVGSPR